MAGLPARRHLHHRPRERTAQVQHPRPQAAIIHFPQNKFPARRTGDEQEGFRFHGLILTQRRGRIVQCLGLTRMAGGWFSRSLINCPILFCSLASLKFINHVCFCISSFRRISARSTVIIVFFQNLYCSLSGIGELPASLRNNFISASPRCSLIHL